MMAVTVGGQAGAGGLEIGKLIANRIDGKYVQKQAIRRVARQLDATVEAVVRKELAYHSRMKRIGHKLEVWISHMGRTWAGDPWGSSASLAMELLPQSSRKELPGEIADSDYRTAIYDNASRYLHEGNVVLTHRAGCLTLKDRHEAVHVGLFSSKDKRVARVGWRYGLGNSDAEDWVETMDTARIAWFKELADEDPSDRSIYDVAIDIDGPDADEHAAFCISEAVMEKRFSVTATDHQTQLA